MSIQPECADLERCGRGSVQKLVFACSPQVMGKPGKELFHGGGLRVSSLVARIAHDAEDSVGGCQVHGLFQGRQSGIRTGDEVPVPAGLFS